MGKRRGNNEGSIGKLKDGRWQGRVTMPSGERKAVYGKSFDECRIRVDELKRQRDEGAFNGKDVTLNNYVLKYIGLETD